MSYDVGAAVLAGLVGGAVMAMLLYAGIAMAPKQMKMNLFYLLGTMMLPTGAVVYVAGAMIHGMMSVAFGLIHTGLYQAFGLESGLWAWGLLFGLAHWIVVGVGMGMMSIVHPRVRSGEVGAPGAFAKNYPPMTVVGFLMLHLIYGLLVGVVYGALV